MWFIGVEVEQETSAPPPKKNPGSAPGRLYSLTEKSDEFLGTKPRMFYCAFHKRELLRSKAAFTTTFFTAVNHSYDHKQRTLKHKNAQNGSKSQITNHDLLNPLT